VVEHVRLSLDQHTGILELGNVLLRNLKREVLRTVDFRADVVGLLLERVDESLEGVLRDTAATG